MEPNKFDNIVKEKLEQRTIQPREMAWDRLDAMLSVAEEKTVKPKKSKRAWMYIAASFLGFLLVGTIFLKQGNNKETEVKSADVQVAVAPGPTVKQDEAKAETESAVVNQAINVKGEAVAVVPSQKVRDKVNAPAVQKKQRATSTSTTIQAAVIVEEAVAQVGKNEIIVEKPIANEAEILLAAATDTDDAKKPAVKVNAKSLLSSVEGELDSSFRNKAMQAIVKNYNTVKTSVANRNHK